MSKDSIFNVSVTTADGNERKLQDYEGKVLFIVNVASKCGFTSQYEQLESVYQKYKSQGFEILAFPSNDFGGQEPGTVEEIVEFCQVNYGVSFEVFDKVHAGEEDTHPLFKQLTALGDPIKWNFEKFLISRDGELIERYGSRIKPDDDQVIKAIEAALGQ
ncbi:glutathione peroxidase [Alkalihalobacterium chitinilyticum]|uniref:Glutathione peroxidase n=1 Tax=Alkalihalobacterium chitinilyticum TaxID=2980103 RepID=A0ABT5VG41_9BACI|nr:glutathione peroxidase [Alkalihalobacterium chitinilyticum]MDE5414425.1 glutathione peroxidase [Alkalihalobacterium chitinilyticum]